MPYLAAIAVDRRQSFILSSDKLQEMKGASRLIEESLSRAKELAKPPEIEVVRPVSGEVWVLAQDLDRLRDYLWRLRAQLVEQLDLSVTFSVVPYNPVAPHDPSDGLKTKGGQLEEVLRVWKNNRLAEDGSPASPLFARCRIQPERPANYWFGHDPKDLEPRRKLLGYGAHIRRERPSEYWKQIKQRVPSASDWKEPREMQDLKASEGDSYVAFIKADVDDLGSIQRDLDWDDLAKRRNCRSTDVLHGFSEAIDDAVKNAVYDTMKQLARPVPANKGEHFPFLPLVLAGDDVWILCRRNLALKFAVLAGKRFRESAHNEKDERLSGIPDRQNLSISFGVLFAKQGYPIDQQLAMAEQLLESAKEHRKGLPKDKQGCLDYFWLASSAREQVDEARREGGGYRYSDVQSSEEKQVKLFSAPWTLEEAEQVLDAADQIRRLPKGKLRQLEGILRLGGPLTKLALHRWWSHLRETERTHLKAAFSDPKTGSPKLPARLSLKEEDFQSKDGSLPRGPWNSDGTTVLLDLVEIAEITGKGDGNE